MGRTVHDFIMIHGVTVKSDLRKRLYFIKHYKLEIKLKSDQNNGHFA